MNNTFRKIAGDAKLSYVRIIKTMREDHTTPSDAETYTGTPEQLQTFSEMIVNECAKLAKLHAINDQSLTTNESLMSIDNYIKSKFK